MTSDKNTLRFSIKQLTITEKKLQLALKVLVTKELDQRQRVDELTAHLKKLEVEKELLQMAIEGAEQSTQQIRLSSPLRILADL